MIQPKNGLILIDQLINFGEHVGHKLEILGVKLNECLAWTAPCDNSNQVQAYTKTIEQKRKFVNNK